jgi:hypothetical protein
MAEMTEGTMPKDYVAFRNGVCVAVADVLEGPEAKEWAEEFYQQYAGCEIKIMPRNEACDALRAAMGPSKAEA